jgi:hypothetical protein
MRQVSQEPPYNPYQPHQPHPPYGGVPWGPPPDHPQATTVLILGVLGVALCQIVAPFAWVMGGRVRREIQESGGTVGGSGIVTAGWAMGIAGSIMLIFGVVAFLGYLAIVGLAIASASGT